MKINLQNFFSDKASVKYTCAKQAVILSKEYPEKVYTNFDFFLQFLHGENKILKWNAMQIIGNLSRVDSQNKVDKVIPDIIAYIFDKSMVTAANAVLSLSEIAKNKPAFKDEILQALLKVKKAKYYSKGKISPECTNVVIGHVIKSLEKFGSDVYKRNDVRLFLKTQTKNTRLKVKRMAEQLLKNNS